ncbi:MAG: monovalent cation/H+ antiporter subunit D family protein [Alphaproteobacteria bacterium]|nr:monovalent cation/H+ antiporter subunit D family protein [Alphaproteobacteria bacterium]
MIEGLSANASLMIFALIIPLFGAFLLPFFSRQPYLRETVSITTALALLFVVIQLLDVFNTGSRPYVELWQMMPQFNFAFALRPLGMIFALVASSLWLITTIYAIGYMRGNNETGQTRFYVCFALAITATMGVAFSANLFTLFVCYEALSLSTYPLVTHKGNNNAMLGGRVYLGTLMGASLGMFLPAMLIIWHVTGTLDFARGGIIQGQFTPLQTGLLLAMLVFGIAKGALMPMHRWLPAAMVAPTPVSALLHAVAVVKAGVFSIVMVIVYIFGFESLIEITISDWRASAWLPYVACFTIVMSSLIALRQDNLKRRLAYSTIGQLSYIILGAALLAPLSLVGAVMHIVAHAFGKITLFFAAGAIYTASHKTNVSELNGIGRAMPWTMGAFTLGTLCMIGVPPTVGFIGKWYLLMGAVDTGHYVAIAALILSTFLNASYLLPIVHAAFFKKPDSPLTHGEAPKPILWALSLTSLATLVLFFYSDGLLQIACEIPSLWEPMHLL